MLGDNRKISSARFIGSHAGAPNRRCECCIRTATQTVTFEYAIGKRVTAACCKRHANMAAKQLGRFLAQRANRDKHFKEILATMAQKAG